MFAPLKKAIANVVRQHQLFGEACPKYIEELNLQHEDFFGKRVEDSIDDADIDGILGSSTKGKPNATNN